MVSSSYPILVWVSITDAKNIFQGADYRRPAPPNHMCVYFCGLDVIMPQLRLDGTDISTSFQQVGCE